MGFWKSFGDTLFHGFRGFGRGFVKVFGWLGRAGLTVFSFAGRIGWRHFFALIYVLLVLYGSVMVTISDRNFTSGLLYLGDSTFGLDSHVVDVVDELKNDDYFMEKGVHRWYSLILPTIEIVGNLFIVYYLYWLWRKFGDLLLDKSRPEWINIISFLFLGLVFKLLYFVVTSNSRGEVIDFFGSASIWFDSVPLVFPLYTLLANFGLWFNAWFVPLFDLAPIRIGGHNISGLLQNTSGVLGNVSQNISVGGGV